MNIRSYPSYSILPYLYTQGNTICCPARSRLFFSDFLERTDSCSFPCACNIPICLQWWQVLQAALVVDLPWVVEVELLGLLEVEVMPWVGVRPWHLRYVRASTMIACSVYICCSTFDSVFVCVRGSAWVLAVVVLENLNRGALKYIADSIRSRITDYRQSWCHY